MGIIVLRPGLSTSVQDMGRYGYAAYGIPESGAMDKYAAGMGNILVGNPQNMAVLEVTRIGPKLQFSAHHQIVISGIEVDAYLNDKKVEVQEVYDVHKGTILDIQRVVKGNFAYLAINDGFQTEKVLNSQSMYEGITPEKVISKGEELPVLSLDENVSDSYSTISFDEQRYKKRSLRFFPGPEFYLLSREQKVQLAQESFTINPDSGRMAFLFQETIPSKEESILTNAVLPGTVQLTPDGHLIVLMRDAQVTGGYPRILQIPERQIDILAQKRPGESLRFSIAQSEV